MKTSILLRNCLGRELKERGPSPAPTRLTPFFSPRGKQAQPPPPEHHGLSGRHTPGRTQQRQVAADPGERFTETVPKHIATNTLAWALH